MFFSKLRFIFDVSSTDTIILNPQKFRGVNDIRGLLGGPNR